MRPRACSGIIRADIELSKQLGIANSPTWLASNRFAFFGPTADKVRRELCARNPGLSGRQRRER